MVVCMRVQGDAQTDGRMAWSRVDGNDKRYVLDLDMLIAEIGESEVL